MKITNFFAAAAVALAMASTNVYADALTALDPDKDGTLDKLKQLYRSPDIKNIGILLDVPKGLVVREALSEASLGAMRTKK